MHKINTDTATAQNEFTDGDSGAALAATELNAAWFNTIQRELCNLVTGSAQTLSEINDSQVLAAVKKLGFQGYYVSNGVLNIGSNSGNSVVFCDCKDIAITGFINANCLLVVIPIWDGSKDKINVSYRGSTFYTYKNNIVFGLISNGNIDGLDWLAWNIPVMTGSRIVFPKAQFTELQATTFKTTDVVYTNPVVEVTSENADTWDDASNWVVGQAKFITSDTNSRKLTYYRNSSTTQATYMYLGFAKQFICLGTTTNASGTSKAILVCCANN